MSLRGASLVLLLACLLNDASAAGPDTPAAGRQDCLDSLARLADVQRLPRRTASPRSSDVWWVDIGGAVAAPLPKVGATTLSIHANAGRLSAALVVQPERKFVMVSNFAVAASMDESIGIGIPSQLALTLDWLNGSVDIGDCSEVPAMAKAQLIAIFLAQVAGGDSPAVALLDRKSLVVRSTSTRGTTWNVLRRGTFDAPPTWLAWTVPAHAAAFRPASLRQRPEDADAPEALRELAQAMKDADLERIMEAAAHLGWTCRWQRTMGPCAEMKQAIVDGVPRKRGEN